MSDRIFTPEAAKALAVLRDEFHAGRIQSFEWIVTGDGIREPMTLEIRIKVIQR